MVNSSGLVEKYKYILVHKINILQKSIKKSNIISKD